MRALLRASSLRAVVVARVDELAELYPSEGLCLEEVAGPRVARDLGVVAGVVSLKPLWLATSATVSLPVCKIEIEVILADLEAGEVEVDGLGEGVGQVLPAGDVLDHQPLASVLLLGPKPLVPVHDVHVDGPCRVPLGVDADRVEGRATRPPHGRLEQVDLLDRLAPQSLEVLVLFHRPDGHAEQVPVVAEAMPCTRTPRSSSIPGAESAHDCTSFVAVETGHCLETPPRYNSNLGVNGSRCPPRQSTRGIGHEQ